MIDPIDATVSTASRAFTIHLTTSSADLAWSPVAYRRHILAWRSRPGQAPDRAPWSLPAVQQPRRLGTRKFFLAFADGIVGLTKSIM
jgi:hypothetical protein